MNVETGVNLGIRTAWLPEAMRMSRIFKLYRQATYAAEINHKQDAPRVPAPILCHHQTNRRYRRAGNIFHSGRTPSLSLSNL